MKHFGMAGLLAALALTTATITTPAAPKEEPRKQDPSTPRGLEVNLVAKQTTYTNLVDKKLLEGAKRGSYPPAPEVDLAFELRNISDMPMHFRIGGDQQRLDLSLNGPGAVSADVISIITLERRPGRIEQVLPGKTFVLPIKRLAYGHRGEGHRAYWTAPGDYTLGATFKMEVGWRNDKEELLKLHPFILKAEPIKLTVKEADKK
jgi:hypothetical protein